MTAAGARRAWAAAPLWRVYLGVGALACAAYLLLAPLKGNGPWMNLIGLSPVVAILVGVHLHRPASRMPWLLLAAGSALFWIGDLYTYSYPHLFRATEVPFPSPGDGLYVLMYPVMMTGLLLLVRRRSGGDNRGGLIDGLILTVGLALPSWIALMAPYLHQDGMSLTAKLVSVAYPLGDVILIGAAIRLALDAGRREPAFYLLTGSICLLLVTDFTYGLLTLNGLYDHQLWLDGGWIGSYLLWGAGGLHPSMARLEQPVPGREVVLTRFRLGLLTCASMVAPAIGVVHDINVGVFDYVVVRSASIMLFGLVVLRMAGLVRQQERSLERERVLSGAGAELVAAIGREAIAGVAVTAASGLAAPGSVAALCVVDADGLLRITAASHGWNAPSGGGLHSEQFAAAVAAGGAERLSGAEAVAAGLPAAHRRLFVVKLAPRRAEPAILIVASDAVASKSEQAAVRALAAQVALALDSAVLHEEIHRRHGEARFASLVRHAGDLIAVIDPDTTVTYQSPSIERILGYGADEMLGRRFDRLVPPGDRAFLARLVGAAAAGMDAQPLDCALVHHDGSTRHFEIQLTNLIHDEHVGGILLNARDVSERKAFEAELTHQAFHDTVTGLANRAMFSERVRHAITRNRRDGLSLSVIFLDLDDFKTINDSLGHASGDEVLVEVARRLDANTRGTDTAARFGGDEFAVLLEDVAGSHEAADTAQRILEMLAFPIRAGHREITVRGSLGISVAVRDDSRNADELIRDADAAMYIAKRDGKGGYRLFEPAMHAGVLARLELRTDLQRAIATDQLDLHYQPIVRLADGSVSGFEALLRWRHPERGVVSPIEFIPIAEETGLIIPIGRWVLREGCRHACRLVAESGSAAPPRMSVNLSLKQIQHSDIVADVRDALAESGLAPERLVLEITESVLMDDTELAVGRLRALKALGVALALDDFGTGYSSLSYLSRFPVDILKMDRSFLSEGSSPDVRSLATAVVGLGASLGLEVVAEGIELSEQWEALNDLGCELGQGFLFARPMDADASLAFLAKQQAHAPSAP